MQIQNRIELNRLQTWKFGQEMFRNLDTFIWYFIGFAVVAVLLTYFKYAGEWIDGSFLTFSKYCIGIFQRTKLPISLAYCTVLFVLWV